MTQSSQLFKVFRNSCLFLLICLIVSCHCDDMACAGLKQEYAAWVNNRFGDSIKFTNGTGNEILFKVNDYQITVDKNVDCTPVSFGCNCGSCETPRSYFIAPGTDTSRSLIDSMGITKKVFDRLSGSVQENTTYSNPKYSISYQVFDHQNNIGLDSNYNLIISHGDSLLPNFTIASRTYNNVLVHKTDTTAPTVYYPHLLYRYFVIKSYYNKEYGVIAFYDQLTQSLFYREF